MTTDFAPLVLRLLQGAIYDTDKAQWRELAQRQADIGSYLAKIGLELRVDREQGLAYLHQPAPAEEDYADDQPDLPRLMRRTPLSYDLTMLCVAARYHLDRFGLCTDPPAVRFRLLDARLAARVGGLTDLTIPQPEFENLALAAFQELKVVVVENKLTFLTLPPLPATLAVWGSGSGLAFLRHCHWLHAAQLYYWGDIDLHGLHILAQLRAYFPGATSVLMDAATYTHHAAAAHAGPVPTQGMPDLLTPSEVRLYQLLLATPAKNRLEQEHLDYEYTSRILQDSLA